jgi:hypothetical protein
MICRTAVQDRLKIRLAALVELPFENSSCSPGALSLLQGDITNQGVPAAKQATSLIPIVFAVANDPLGSPNRIDRVSRSQSSCAIYGGIGHES